MTDGLISFGADIYRVAMAFRSRPPVSLKPFSPLSSCGCHFFALWSTAAYFRTLCLGISRLVILVGRKLCLPACQVGGPQPNSFVMVRVPWHVGNVPSSSCRHLSLSSLLLFFVWSFLCSPSPRASLPLSTLWSRSLDYASWAIEGSGQGWLGYLTVDGDGYMTPTVDGR